MTKETNQRRVGRRRISVATGWKVAAAVCTIAAGALAYVAVHALSAPLPSMIAGALSIASGLAWIGSAISRSTARLVFRLDVLAAGLAILAAICALP